MPPPSHPPAPHTHAPSPFVCSSQARDKVLAGEVIDVSSPNSISQDAAATGGGDGDGGGSSVVMVEATSPVLAIDPGAQISPTAGSSTTPEEKDILIQVGVARESTVGRE